MKNIRGGLVAASVIAGGALVAAAPSAGQYGYGPPSSTPAPHAKRAANHVDVVDFAFRPQSLHVKKGATVTWAWKGSAMHNVTFRSLNKHSKTQSRGSFRLKFARSGTFHYMCTIHGFTGTIVVR